MGHGIRYLIVAIGSPDDHATEEDVEVLRACVGGTGLHPVALSERMSDRLTALLLLEEIAASTQEQESELPDVSWKANND